MNKKISEEKRKGARLLLAEGAPYREVAYELGISIGSVHNIAKEPPETLSPLIEEIKKRTSTKLLLLADHILNRISDLNLTYASLKDKVIASAILIDKAKEVESRMPKLNKLNTEEKENANNSIS